MGPLTGAIVLIMSSELCIYVPELGRPGQKRTRKCMNDELAAAVYDVFMQLVAGLCNSQRITDKWFGEKKW